MFEQEFLDNLGIVAWGYTEDPISQSYDRYLAWNPGALSYLADHRKDFRKDLRLFYPEFQSALVFLFSYAPTKKWMLESNKHDVAAYTLGFGGEDYHEVLKLRLRAIRQHLNLDAYNIIDSQPVLERDLAYRAGLGWFGKNSMLINQKEGSYFIIGSLLLKEKLPLPSPQRDIDHCGHCTACVDACPTLAINPQTRSIIADKCISTFTIELPREAPIVEGFEKSRGEIFGCDICQDVCPWNKKILPRVRSQLQIPEFLKKILYQMPKDDLFRFIYKHSNRAWARKLEGTVFDRPGRKGWLKNLRSLLSTRNDF